MEHLYKLLIIILVLAFGLSAYAKPNYSFSNKSEQSHYPGTYINEEIDVPTTKIGLPSDFYRNDHERT